MQELGAYVDKTVSMLHRSGWHATIVELRGRSDLHPLVKELPHPAAPLLDRLRKNGAPVVLKSPPWSPAVKQARFLRGPHKSALEHSEFLAQEFLDFCRKGYWMLLPYNEVKDRPELRLSPIGVVPQRERRPRVIVDYSYFGVNDDTLKLAPQESMQFGYALRRMMQEIVEANRVYGDTYIYKVDVSDGFYRVWLCSSGVAKLGVTLPPMAGLPRLVAFPLVLPMGWTESPPYFSVLTETVCDLTNGDLRKNSRYSMHPLEALAAVQDDACNLLSNGSEGCSTSTNGDRLRRKIKRRPLATVDVFVDDFCGLGQDHHQNPMANQRRTLFHNLDKVFRKNDDDDPPTRKEPNSMSKLAKGDASLNVRKRALGWDLDGHHRTLGVPPHRAKRALETLGTLAMQSRVSQQKWQSLLGDLRNLEPGIPGGRGQFSVLQAALTGAKQGRVRVTKDVRAQLGDLHTLVKDLTRRSTSMEELVPEQHPKFIGASDAAKPGMGGVWLPPQNEASVIQPLLWRQPFPEAVQNLVVSADNRKGRITNSDLELAATIASQYVLASSQDIALATTHTFCDNTPAVAWQNKGSTTSTGPPAYLLRIGALHQRQHRYLAKYQYLPGAVNTMADDASRKWDLTDEQLLTRFDTNYPQVLPWKLLTVPPLLNSALISSLYRRRLPLESYPVEPANQPDTGRSGANSVRTSLSTRDYQASATRYLTSNCSLGGIEMGDSLPVVDRFGLEQWKMPYARWGRRFPHWGPRTLANLPRTVSTSGYKDSSAGINEPTPRPREFDPFLWLHSARPSASQTLPSPRLANEPWLT